MSFRTDQAEKDLVYIGSVRPELLVAQALPHETDFFESPSGRRIVAVATGSELVKLQLIKGIGRDEANRFGRDPFAPIRFLPDHESDVSSVVNPINRPCLNVADVPVRVFRDNREKRVFVIAVHPDYKLFKTFPGDGLKATLQILVDLRVVHPSKVARVNVGNAKVPQHDPSALKEYWLPLHEFDFYIQRAENRDDQVCKRIGTPALRM